MSSMAEASSPPTLPELGLPENLPSLEEPSIVETLRQDIWATSSDYSQVSREEAVRISYAIAIRDSAALTILTIHWNLCIGTIAPFAKTRPDLRPLLDDLQQFRICGQFMLTELGHGLDARNIETTATLQDDGSFHLHTPNPAAAKAMPPSTTMGAVPKVAVVFARLIAAGQDVGIKPFLVRLCDADGMCAGVTAKVLPSRAGAKPLDHALTSFDQVVLDRSALLGTMEKAHSPRMDFLTQLWRVAVGTLAISLTNVPALKTCAYIAWKHSRGRQVASESGKRVSILEFSTQYGPVLHCAMQGAVMDAYADETIKMFRDQSLRFEVRHAVATTFKATIIDATQPALAELVDRCGWRGLYGFNQIAEIMLAQRGNSIAEGDYLVLCIRLASEVLLGRYQLPAAKDPTCLLAQHEHRLWTQAHETLTQIANGKARSAAFNAHILPRCRALVVATGQRMAYEAARDAASITPQVLALYESTCVLADPADYCESGHKMRDLQARHVAAVDAALPQLSTLVDAEDIRICTSSPLVDSLKWEEFIGGLPTFQHVATADINAKL
ncbi:hypothetical protein S40285_01805 [Stachybotrys chlorohalonatus IBT 40285]|uniref:Uncharacterized protein n=1 Tax=Stachybotrys chlorohalonatus (strain IBT 40285) TaxID=1283841 RepID=A0A084QH89_STAC4|nr:hypothetical protein S40285_01805 [Stachybotrys chlorohalonata IBT 40285]